MVLPKKRMISGKLLAGWVQTIWGLKLSIRTALINLLAKNHFRAIAHYQGIN
jgi:hypothetical protein